MYAYTIKRNLTIVSINFNGFIYFTIVITTDNMGGDGFIDNVTTTMIFGINVNAAKKIVFMLKSNIATIGKSEVNTNNCCNNNNNNY